MSRTPTAYLSTSGGKFRVISQGLPICADKASLAEALDAAGQVGVKVSRHVWNGDAGKFEPPLPT